MSYYRGKMAKKLALVIAWFGGQLRINFLSEILKFFRKGEGNY